QPDQILGPFVRGMEIGTVHYDGVAAGCQSNQKPKGEVKRKSIGDAAGWQPGIVLRLARQVILARHRGGGKNCSAIETAAAVTQPSCGPPRYAGGSAGPNR